MNPYSRASLMLNMVKGNKEEPVPDYPCCSNQEQEKEACSMDKCKIISNDKVRRWLQFSCEPTGKKAKLEIERRVDNDDDLQVLQTSIQYVEPQDGAHVRGRKHVTVTVIDSRLRYLPIIIVICTHN